MARASDGHGETSSAQRTGRKVTAGDLSAPKTPTRAGKKAASDTGSTLGKKAQASGGSTEASKATLQAKSAANTTANSGQPGRAAASDSARQDESDISKVAVSDALDGQDGDATDENSLTEPTEAEEEPVDETVRGGGASTPDRLAAAAAGAESEDDEDDDDEPEKEGQSVPSKDLLKKTTDNIASKAPSQRGDDIQDGIQNQARNAKNKAAKQEPDNMSKEKSDETAEDAQAVADAAQEQTHDKEDEGVDAIPIGKVDKHGTVRDGASRIIATVVGDDAKSVPAGSIVDQDLDIMDQDGNVIGKAEAKDQQDQADSASTAAKDKATGQAGDLSVTAQEEVSGDTEADAEADADRTTKGPDTKDEPKETFSDGESTIKQDAEEVENTEESGEAEDGDKDLAQLDHSVLDGKKVDVSGMLVDDEQLIWGKLVKGEPKKLKGRESDEKGDIRDTKGKVVGHAVPVIDEDRQKLRPDPSILAGKKINSFGNICDEQGTLLGLLIEGDAHKLDGMECDEEGQVWDNRGQVVGRAEAVLEKDRRKIEQQPFEDFESALVQKNGDIVFEGRKIGELVEGDAKKLENKSVAPNGGVYDKNGNQVGHAKRWDEPEKEAEPEVDLSELSGKRVNKKGFLVDKDGSIFGQVIKGDLKRLVGQMSDNKGQIWGEGGHILGQAELLNEAERQNSKEGSFSHFLPCKVDKDALCYDSKGMVRGKVVQGDPKALEGHELDEDGEVLSKEGNSIGRAERYELEDKPKDKHPAAGFKVNREGYVINAEGEQIAKLTTGEISRCHGKEVDDDGDIKDQKGVTIGWVTLLEDLEPEKSDGELEKERQEAEQKQKEEEEERSKEEEERKTEEEREQDRKLAKRLAYVIQDGIDKVTPTLDNITDAINRAENTPKEDLDEEQLVQQVRPMIEQASHILAEINGSIRGMDPDGRIQSHAKAQAAAGEATPEEHRVADLLKQLSEKVQGTIENAKKKIAGMPHAKEELNPLWGLLQEPLFQIVAAVGLLLNGVLSLLGKILGVLGLGGLLDKLLGGLGLDKILKGLGLGGGGGKKKSGGGGGSGGLLGGIL